MRIPVLVFVSSPYLCDIRNEKFGNTLISKKGKRKKKTTDDKKKALHLILCYFNSSLTHGLILKYRLSTVSRSNIGDTQLLRTVLLSALVTNR